MNLKREIELIVKAVDQSSGPLDAIRLRLDQLSKQYLGVSLSAAGWAAGIASAAALVVGTMTKVALESIKIGEAFDDMSQRTGISASELARWDFVAQRAGSDIQTFQLGLRSLSMQMGAARDGSLEAQRAFRRLGVEWTDSSGNLRNLNSMLYELADAFAGIDDRAARIDLAQAVLGRGGMGLLPALQQGSAGLRELQARYAELGPLSDQFATAAGKAGDAQGDFNIALRNFKAQISEPLLGPLTQGLTLLATGLGRMTEAARISGGGFKEQFIAALLTQGIPGLRLTRVEVEKLVLTIEDLDDTLSSMAVKRPLLPGLTDPAAFQAAKLKTKEELAKLIADLNAAIRDAEPLRIPIEPMIDTPGFEGADWSREAMLESMYGLTSEQQRSMEIEASLNEDRAEGARLLREQAEEMEDIRRNAEEAAWAAAGEFLNALTSVSALLGGTNSKWMQDLYKIQQIYQTILAIKQAIAAIETAAHFFGLLSGGGQVANPMAVGGMVRGAEGFVVRGGRAGIDSVPALLMPNELVVDRRTTLALQRFLANQDAGYISPFVMDRSRGRAGEMHVHYELGWPTSRAAALELGARAAEAQREYERRLLQ